MTVNEFEQQIVIQLLEGIFFERNAEDVTPEKCKQGIIDFSPEFPWDNINQLRAVIAVSELPTDMVSLACKLAWQSVNWDDVANEVKHELSTP